MNFRKIIVSTFLMLPLIAQSQSWMSFTVHKGESLSNILKSLGIKPIYGENGTLAQTISLNPELRRSKGNRIFPGQKIHLPKLMAELTPQVPLQIEQDKAPERVITTEVADDVAALISTTVGVDFFKIEGVDKTTNDNSVVLSEASLSVGLGHHLLWDQVTTLSVNAKFQKYKLQDLNNGQSFDDANGNKIDLSFRVMRQFSERWNFGAGVAFEQDIFFHALSSSELSVDKVLITKPEVYVRYIALAKSNSNLGLDGKYGVNLANETSDYKIKTGTHAGVGAYFKYHSKLLDQNYKSLETKIFYSVDNQDTSVSTRKLSNLSFMILYDWKIPW